MTDEAELEYERDLSRVEIADYFERFAEGLRGGGEIELTIGGETAVVNPPETVEFELELEDEPEDGGVERSVEFELEWMRTEGESPLPTESEEETEAGEPEAEAPDESEAQSEDEPEADDGPETKEEGEAVDTEEDDEE